MSKVIKVEDIIDYAVLTLNKHPRKEEEIDIIWEFMKQYYEVAVTYCK